MRPTMGKQIAIKNIIAKHNKQKTMPTSTSNDERQQRTQNKIQRATNATITSKNKMRS